MIEQTVYPRRAIMFTDAAGVHAVPFPGALYEYEGSQALRTAQAALVGADYMHDYLGDAPGLKAEGRESIRFMVHQPLDDVSWASITVPWETWDSLWGLAGISLDGAIDLIRSMCQRNGRGRLWTIARDGTRRWAYARLVSAPAVQVRVPMMQLAPVTLEFRRESDWYDETPTTGSAALSASPATVTITNPGNAEVRDAVLTLTGPFDEPEIDQLTTGEHLASERVGATTAAVLRIDAGGFAVERSADGGATWADDYDQVAIGATQASLITLQPGDNTVRVTGAAGGTIAWSFRGAYH